MLVEKFYLVFGRIMGHEGGYVNDADDPGGETNWGISKRSYPDEDIKNLTRERAMFLFRRDFWNAVDGEHLEDGIAFQASDAAYHHGAMRSIMFLQKAIGVADDGHFGAISKMALKDISESDVVMRFNAERIDFLTRLSKFDKYGRGWMRRIAKNLRYGADDSD